ncbi:biotin--[acetyl-CoA-carboxylase] ligase [Salinicoccus halodurans]|uniref:biotin--[acetyl-CoA-carboxylase] ligase n=1 Tax=Salinicoccus halodurans TaxID=407035 RepID=UPI000A515FFC|nr:biotin--[acetyl-CoA-carboxylase] ligase [Salinicoccus halodurans]
MLDREQFISGQNIADTLGVSRTAIWKTIQSLKEEGYSIESVTSKGYHLKNPPKYLSPTALSVLIGQSGLFSNVEYFTTTPSTQKEAFRMLSETKDSFMVVAEEQTQGRGRFDRHWDSPGKTGIYISLVLRPNIPITEIIRFNLFISLAISKSLDEAFGVDTGIKWPNDIYLDDKKICGFLTEVVSESGVINAIICGIGINIFKDDSRLKIPTATSIEDIIGSSEKIDVDSFMERFLDNIEIYYNRFLNEPFSLIREDWKEKSIIFGKELRITETGSMFMARALDINEDGFLEVLDEEGNIRKIISADIEL